MSNASASQTAGVVGKFGQSTFTSVSSLGKFYYMAGDENIFLITYELMSMIAFYSGSGQRNPRLPPKPSKFFKSRNLNDVSEAIIEEEEEEEDVLEETRENISVLTGGYQTPLGGKSGPGSENITVGVRVRPSKEMEGDVLQIDGTQLVVDNDEKKVFNFDTVLKSDVTQEQVYQDLVQGKVEKFLEGFSSTVFAYGQTGTGKTFSMGTTNTMQVIDTESRGIILRSLQQIFTHEDIESQRLKVWISFLEIHKEQVFDLLNPGKDKDSLSVREIRPGLFKVLELTEIQVQSVSEAVNILHQGSSLRSTETTLLNCQSSRSHAIYTVRLESSDADGNSVSRKLSLVDLAGSENSNKTKCTGTRFEEAKSINLGLTVLNRVVTGLVRRQKHIPYRDSMLTKVLKEGLQVSCHISMLACISPGQADITETLNTLRFCNEAKHIRLRPLPSNIMDSCRASAAKKRELGLGISATPHGVNNTIHGVATPSTAIKRQALNRTIGTPGKRARTEEDFTTSSIMRSVVSSTVSKVSSLQSLSDISSVSMIEPPLEATVSSATTVQHDVTGLLSPLIRTVRETVQEEMMKIKSEMINPQISSRKPKKKLSSRATSSPNKTNLFLLDMDEDSDIVRDNIEVTGVAEEENIISGVGLSFPKLPRSVNPRHRAVMESASPTLSSNDPPLFQYDSPPSSSRRRSQSPTIEEMERNLGINPDSPSLLFNVTQQAGTVVKKSRKSSRRTTLVGTDLNETLKEIQNFTSSNRRRSLRAATKGIFYGSPSQKQEKLDDEEEKQEVGQEVRHPLLVQERRMDPARQERHNRTILDLINIGTVKHLGVSSVFIKTRASKPTHI